MVYGKELWIIEQARIWSDGVRYDQFLKRRRYADSVDALNTL